MSMESSMKRKAATALDHLDDVDISADSLFDMVDTDNNGTIDKREFAQIFIVMKEHVRKEHAEHLREEAEIMKAKKRTKLMGVVLGVVTLFLGIAIAANAISTYGVIEATKEMRMSGSSMVSGDGTPVSTTDNLVGVKLMVLPALDIDQIVKVRYLHFHYTDVEHDPPVIEAHFTISKVLKYNDTYVELFGPSLQERVVVRNGVAMFYKSSTDHVYQLCGSNVGCSAFKYDAVLAEEAETRAVDALASIGITNARRLFAKAPIALGHSEEDKADQTRLEIHFQQSRRKLVAYCSTGCNKCGLAHGCCPGGRRLAEEENTVHRLLSHLGPDHGAYNNYGNDNGCSIEFDPPCSGAMGGFDPYDPTPTRGRGENRENRDADK